MNRKTFSTYEKAHAAAKGIASSLLVGKPDVLMLTGQDLLIYQRAKEALQPVGVSLDTANRKSVVVKRRCSRYGFSSASVAQLDRASDFGSEGCRFESCRMRHFQSTTYVD